ncbi:ATP-binding protein [uncultured Nostoc sp.]|uniref:ATP-binding protein n=1 Tax=uncultured Nostoc sp. TaxID=340711 RepID=UPI002623445F|nr:ATP-binding protein [uncultured Nostoc sp.]
MPSELKRKGRFDENFFVDLPTELERCQILKIHLERFGIVVESEYLEAIVANTAKFSGAELETIAAEAALLAFDEGRPQQVTLGDFDAILREYHTSGCPGCCICRANVVLGWISKVRSEGLG